MILERPEGYSECWENKPPDRRLSASQCLGQIDSHAIFASPERWREEREHAEKNGLASGAIPIYNDVEYIIIGFG